MKYLLLIICWALLLPAHAQKKNAYGQTIKMMTVDKLLLNFNYIQWMDLPEPISLQNINRGFALQWFEDLPLSSSRVALALGLGLDAKNLYSDVFPGYIIDSSGFVQTGNISGFAPAIRNNKMVFVHAFIPVELRWRPGKDEQWRLAAGFRAGYLISSYWKYHGDNIFHNKQEDIKLKYYRLQQANVFDYGLTFRLGYNRYTLQLYYALSSIFEESLSRMYPVEIGFVLMVF